ncbi:MAG: enolase C-terminal domain-like protein [Verrucomicrobiota bacterium]
MSVVIAAVETFAVCYPVVGRFKFFENTSGKPTGRLAVVVKLTASDGTVGWGLSGPSPRWSYETLETIQTTIDRYLAPELAGRDPFDTEGITHGMNTAIAPSFSTGQPICKAGIDLALFDLTGRLLGQSAAQRWKKSCDAPVTLSWTLNPRTLDEVEPQVAAARSRGYRHFNVKVAPDVAFDVELCGLIRKLAPDGTLWADANGGYDEASALEAAPKLADLGVSFVEQPVPANRLGAYRRLKQQGALPIIMDEGLVSCVELEEFHRLGLLDGAAIKVQRCGGLTEARRQVEFLRENGLLFLGSGLTDPDMSLAACVLLYSAYGLEYAAALNGPQFLETSLLKQPLKARDGKLSSPTGPGLGVDVDEAKLRAMLCAS